MAWFRFMGFNATFNNISVILWQSVLLVEKTTDLSQITDKLCACIKRSPWGQKETVAFKTGDLLIEV
jgi:hypothetical protein